MWPPEALAFLRELEDNNDRDWFRANRARYDAHLVEPARALAQSLEHLGEPRLFRPYNDARFGPRPPIKEQLGMAIGYGAAGGYYVELSLDGLLVGAGLHHPATDQLERFRAAIDDEPRARTFDRALDRTLEAGMQIIDPELKRAARLPRRPSAHRAPAPQAPDGLLSPRAAAVAARARLRAACARAARRDAPARAVAGRERRAFDAAAANALRSSVSLGRPGARRPATCPCRSARGRR